MMELKIASEDEMEYRHYTRKACDFILEEYKSRFHHECML